VNLPETEANHATRVLRLKDGDTVEAIDGQGHSVPAILRVHGGPVRLELPTATPQSKTDVPGAIVPLILEMAVLKGDAMEWTVEKTVELGIRRLIPVLTAHTVVQIKSKGPEAFRERWQKIADQALKQCGRLERLKIDLPTPLTELMPAQKTDCPRLWCDEAAASGKDPDLLSALGEAWSADELRLLIGPEGGWSSEEREMLAKAARKVTLGPLVLRAETAAIQALSLASATYRTAKLLTKKHG
jgi:16S rRNA (uracil1498-N3)-methyltransferase